MATANDYITSARRLLHDPTGQYWNTTDQLSNVNEAVKMRDRVTGGNRSLIEYSLTAGTGVYTFTDLGNTRVFDVVGITVLFNGLRIVLEQVSYTRLVTLYRAWNTYRDVPIAFARYGAASVRIGPLPSSDYDTEWDCCVVSADLAATDEDPLPYPYTEPVPYWAAYLCKINGQKWEEAEAFKAQFYDLCNSVEGTRTGVLPSAYAGAGYRGR